MSTQNASRLFNRIDQYEIDLCKRINRYSRVPLALNYFKVVSRLGDGVLWYCVIIVLPIIYGEPGIESALRLTLTGIVCTVIYKFLKNRLVRERPFFSYPTIKCGTPPLDRYSFPSGHTLHAVCFTVILLFIHPLFALLILPFTISVALSRIILGLHYPTDVVAGAMLGGFLGFLAVQIQPPVIL